jgi:hypothetical protein
MTDIQSYPEPSGGSARMPRLSRLGGVCGRFAHYLNIEARGW